MLLFLTFLPNRGRRFIGTGFGSESQLSLGSLFQDGLLLSNGSFLSGRHD